MNCYACDNAATNACKRCTRPYCDEHGNGRYCAECLQPASALPSFNLYRGAMLVMLVGTAVAVLLIVRPPGESKGAAPVVVGKTTATSTPSGGGTPVPTVPAETPDTSAPAAGSSTAAAALTSPPAAPPSPAGTESPWDEYIIQEGDTLFGIAQAHLHPGDDLGGFVGAIAVLNQLDQQDPLLQVGRKLYLPKASAPSSRP